MSRFELNDCVVVHRLSKFLITTNNNLTMQYFTVFLSFNLCGGRGRRPSRMLATLVLGFDRFIIMLNLPIIDSVSLIVLLF